MKQLPDNFGQPDCQCKHCQGVKTNSSKHLINHGKYKKASELAANELNRVSLPGDVDYEPQAVQAKRGKDIKTFEDRPADVRANIRRVSESNEEFRRRTAIAINYQHLFPERFNSTGIDLSSNPTHRVAEPLTAPSEG